MLNRVVNVKRLALSGFLAAGILAPLSSVTHAAPAHFELESEHTYAYFKVMHADRGWFTGVIKDVQGWVTLDEADKTGKNHSVEVKLDLKTLDSFNKKRDQHLLSPDFFDAATVSKDGTIKPIIRRGVGGDRSIVTFKSTKVSPLPMKKGEKMKEFSVEGDLTMRGQTKKVTARAVMGAINPNPQGGTGTGGNVYFSIKRSDWGMAKIAPPAVGDEVKIDLYWEGIQKPKRGKL